MPIWISSKVCCLTFNRWMRRRSVASKWAFSGSSTRFSPKATAALKWLAPPLFYTRNTIIYKHTVTCLALCADLTLGNYQKKQKNCEMTICLWSIVNVSEWVGDSVILQQRWEFQGWDNSVTNRIMVQLISYSKIILAFIVFMINKFNWVPNYCQCRFLSILGK